MAVLLPFHYCWIVICFIDYHWHSLGSGQGLPWPGEGCSAKGARLPAAAVDAQPRTPEQLAQAPGHGGQQEQSSQRAS